jgi:hypothetical protein
MDPTFTSSSAANLGSPTGSKVNLALNGDREELGLGRPGEGKREVFSDFKRFVSFGLGSRRESQQGL